MVTRRVASPGLTGVLSHGREKDTVFELETSKFEWL